MTKKTAGQRLWRHRVIPVAVVVLVVGAIAGTRAFATGGNGPSYRLGLVTKGSVDQTLTLSGTVRKAAQATSSFTQLGTVKSVAVAVGDEVTAGQTLATLDPTALRRAIIAAEATLAQAKATLATDEGSAATAGYDSFTTTPPEVFAITTALVISTGPPRTPAQAAAAVQKSAAAVTAAQKAAQSALATAKADLAAATLTAPISGTVAAVGYVPGSASGSNSITIVGPGAVDVRVNVPLTSLPKVKVGQPARVASTGSAATVAGTVRSISLLPASSPSTSVTYPVVVRVPEPTAAMASGSTATATITLSTVKDVLTVPNSALTSLAAGTAIATVVKNGTATRALVRTGAVGPTRTQVLSGLTEGQRVVIADLSEPLPTNTFGNNRFGNRSGLTSGLSGTGGLGGGGFGGGRVFVNGGPPPG
jgi:multidrug efflux pump subunit AcrA (membrane-fusion protein)